MKHKKAFSLVELLVASAITVSLAVVVTGILGSALGQYRYARQAGIMASHMQKLQTTIETDVQRARSISLFTTSPSPGVTNKGFCIVMNPRNIKGEMQSAGEQYITYGLIGSKVERKVSDTMSNCENLTDTAVVSDESIQIIALHMSQAETNKPGIIELVGEFNDGEAARNSLENTTLPITVLRSAVYANSAIVNY